MIFLNKLFLIIFIFLYGCNPKQLAMVQLEGKTMGTTYKVIYLAGPESHDSSTVSSLIQKELKNINQSMSTYIEDSELSKINQIGEGKWIGLSKNIAEVLKKSFEINEMSKGVFDVTLGPVINLWGFGPKGEKKIPDESEISLALSKTGLNKIEFDYQLKRLRKKQGDVYIDLSALAKGYGVDKVSFLLNNLGIINYFIEIGGEISVRGKKYQNPWKVGIEKPNPLGKEIQKILEVTDLNMATSGNYRNFFVEDGKNFSHTIDFKTGKPVKNSLVSVTVIHPVSCMDADAYATALMAMGTQLATEFVLEQKLAVFMIYSTKDNQLKTYKSPKFKDLFGH